MTFTIINPNGERRVAFFLVRDFAGIVNKDLEGIAVYSNVTIHVFETDDFRFQDAFMRMSTLEDHLKLEDSVEMQNIYEYILDYVKSTEIEVCLFFGSGFLWSKNFLDTLRLYSYPACYFADDPEGADVTSKFYVKNFNYAFCGGVYFDENTLIVDKYKEWGVSKAKFVPLGVNPTKRREKLNALDNRDHDLIYVGSCYFPKVLRMFRLKKHFGDRMLLYGRGWNSSNSKLKTLVLKCLKYFFNIPFVEELSKSDLIDLYQNTKIGFNLHMSYGPSNQRMYELPANGVMQLCDNEKGLANLYLIDKEVVTYKNMADAIEKIEFYLRHPEKRKEIAMAGYLRVKNEFFSELSFQEIFNSIFSDIEKSKKI